MKDFPSCFGENGVQVADFSSSNTSSNNNNKAAAPQNTVTCVYECQFHTKSCWITITWSKNLMGQCLSVGIDDYTNQNQNQPLCKTDIKPWLFSKKKGSKILEANSFKIEIFWDLSSAKFGSGPEPLEDFYVGIYFNKQMILLLGDMRKEALKRTNSTQSLSSAVFVSKREHIFGKKIFTTKARFSDTSRAHDLVIECDVSSSNEPWLVIRLDGKMVVQVKRLRWKFRGNDSVIVDGVDVDVFWDVHNWLFGTSFGNGVFMFKTRDLKSDDEKLWASRSRSCFDDYHQLQSVGFSLVLHAWKNE